MLICLSGMSSLAHKLFILTLVIAPPVRNRLKVNIDPREQFSYKIRLFALRPLGVGVKTRMTLYTRFYDIT